MGYSKPMTQLERGAQQGRTMVPRIVGFLSEIENFERQLMDSAGANDGTTHCGNPLGGCIDTDSEETQQGRTIVPRILVSPLRGFGRLPLSVDTFLS